MRPGPQDEPISNLIGYPGATGGPWYRCAWLLYSENIYMNLGHSTFPANWQVAWHGTRMEALYSIM